MRDVCDQRLTDPTAEEVSAALVAAVEAVNAKHAAGNLTATDGAVVVGERVAREPEGVYRLIGSNNPPGVGRLVLSWLTDSIGQKFVRIRGWRERDPRGPTPPSTWPTSEDIQAFHNAEDERARRPVMWHVDHERVIETFTDGDPEWVAVCGCGAAGSPASLAWQHGMCGPCADRIAEYGLDAVKHAPGLLAHADFVPDDMTFALDGKFVVAVNTDQYLVWNLETAEVNIGINWDDRSDAIRPTTSPDGHCVFLGFDDGRGPHLAIPQREVWRRDYLGVPLFGPLRAAFWTGREREMLIQTAEHGFTNLYHVNAGTITPDTQSPDPRARLLAVWHDATAPRAVFAAGHRASVSHINSDGTLAVEARFQLGDGDLNRTGLWANGPEIVRFTPDGERLLFIRGSEMELRLPSRPKALLQVTFPKMIRDAAFSPDYEHLYVLGTDGAIYVCNPGTLGSVRARLRWHIGPVSRMAISPDGSTLATAGAEGVKLWPVSQLLPLLG